MSLIRNRQRRLLEFRRCTRDLVRRRALLATRKVVGEPVRSAVAEMFFFSRAYQLPRLLEQLRERVDRMANVDAEKPSA